MRLTPCSCSHRFGISVAGISSDGDSRLLRAMKIETRLGQIRPPNMPYYYNCAFTDTACVQDATHIGTKMRNKFLQASILLPMGNRLVTLSHLKMLIEELPKSVHGLVLSDICPDDRQNFQSLQKIMDPKVLKCVQENIPESEATVLYLKLCRYVTSAFLDPNLSPLDRVYRSWFAILFLRIWRNWISKSDTYDLNANWITSNAYECIELNGHQLIQLIRKFRNEGNEKQFIPFLMDSQACESSFRKFRSMTSVFWTKINSTLLELFHLVGRVELQNYISSFKIPEVQFPRNQGKKTEWSIRSCPPTRKFSNKWMLPEMMPLKWRVHLT